MAFIRWSAESIAVLTWHDAGPMSSDAEIQCSRLDSIYALWSWLASNRVALLQLSRRIEARHTHAQASQFTTGEVESSHALSPHTSRQLKALSDMLAVVNHKSASLETRQPLGGLDVEAFPMHSVSLCHNIILRIDLAGGDHKTGSCNIWSIRERSMQEIDLSPAPSMYCQ